MGLDYGFCTFVTACVILAVQLHHIHHAELTLSSLTPLVVPGRSIADSVHVKSKDRHKVVERNGVLVYEDGEIPHPSYVKVALENEEQPELDIMEELSKLRIAANTQKEVLIAANRMPPETPVSRMIAERTRSYMKEDEEAAKVLPASLGVPGLGGIVSQPSVSSIGQYLFSHYANGLGVVLGVGRGNFVKNLFAEWSNMAGLYLVDPYIHLYKGYESPFNVDDRTHQLIFEKLRQELHEMGVSKFAFIRDFSFECTLCVMCVYLGFS